MEPQNQVTQIDIEKKPDARYAKYFLSMLIVIYVSCFIFLLSIADLSRIQPLAVSFIILLSIFAIQFGLYKWGKYKIMVGTLFVPSIGLIFFQSLGFFVSFILSSFKVYLFNGPVLVGVMMVIISLLLSVILLVKSSLKTLFRIQIAILFFILLFFCITYMRSFFGSRNTPPACPPGQKCMTY